jgi:hypothetical protein
VNRDEEELAKGVPAPLLPVKGPFPSAGAWQPIAEYTPDMGVVLVWVSWHEYDKRVSGMTELGRWEQARQVQLGVAGAHRDRLWVYHATGQPLEVVCRATHFCMVRRPT